MLQIRQEQMDQLKQETMRRFLNEMLAHSRQFSPRLCEVLGEPQLRIALNMVMDRARDHGFTNRGPIRLFVELVFLFGSSFDTDPQYSKISASLNDDLDQMDSAEQMHRAYLDYFDRVAGSDNSNIYNALERLSIIANMPSSFSSKLDRDGLTQQICDIFPQKASYIGNDALNTIIKEAREAARYHDFYTARAEALICVLMFTFGHGCMYDPLYPWIQQTLVDDRIVDATARATRLERKARTWLNHVLARNERRMSP